MTYPLALLMAAVLSAGAVVKAAESADLSARDVTVMLVTADPSAPVDLARRDLSFLDLSGLDFKAARLHGTDLYGVDLTRSRLTGADLEGVRLDRASIAKADFSGARLRGASLRSITAHLTIDLSPGDAPNFTGADLTDAHIAARLDGVNFSNANLTRAQIGRLVPTWGSYRPRAVLNSANFRGATLEAADLRHGMFRFAQFNGADLRGADLRECDFSAADFSGANFSGANLADADFDGAILTGVVGLDEAIGLDQAKNVAKAIR